MFIYQKQKSEEKTYLYTSIEEADSGKDCSDRSSELLSITSPAAKKRAT